MSANAHVHKLPRLTVPHTVFCVQITEREFQELFPDQVVRVRVVHDTGALDPLVKDYEVIKRKLEDLLDEYLGCHRQMKKIKRKKVSCC